MLAINWNKTAQLSWEGRDRTRGHQGGGNDTHDGGPRSPHASFRGRAALQARTSSTRARSGTGRDALPGLAGTRPPTSWPHSWLDSGAEFGEHFADEVVEPAPRQIHEWGSATHHVQTRRD